MTDGATILLSSVWFLPEVGGGGEWIKRQRILKNIIFLAKHKKIAVDKSRHEECKIFMFVTNLGV